MRSVGDERGREPRDDRRGDVAPDPEATRVFTRGGSGTADDPYGAPGAQPVRGPVVERTRTFTREDPGGGPDPAEDGFGGDMPERGRRGRRGRRSRPAAPDRPRRRVRIRWIVALLLVTALALPPGTWGWVWYTARQDERPQSDAIIVLGASQYNGRPSPIFEARLRHAADLYRDGVAPVIVTVGGNLPGDNFTEAGSGRDWLVQVGVPAEQVVAVDTGNDTLQSIEAVGRVFDERQWATAVIVTDPWHSLRSRQMAQDFGIDASTSPARSGPAVIERRTQVWYITRETASLWYYWIFGSSSDISVDAA
ncbi:ElyC/SanA/YdcF family protein [Nocardiopsis mwathae]|uniref:ElyC/SanA/YdcF family protein n=1 Tax=Nocardiopsis mwathae TaxID=1472723 RepID=UPI001618C96D